MILIDTGAWYALTDPQERHHGRAVALFGRLTRGEHGRMVTSDYILDETYTLIRMRLGIEPVKRLRGLLGQSSSIQVVRVSDNDFERSADLMIAHEDKRWSLTNCTSFILMRELEIGDAFTFDRNFAEAGFRALPSS
ncbi:MAG: type II toxin-antitoxin system VapC family toxin [Candidatus Lutacidiplasmatales archaeon]